MEEPRITLNHPSTDFIKAVETWIINRFSLSTYPYFELYMLEDDPYEELYDELGFTQSEPEFIVRLLPLLWDYCTNEEEQLDPFKFEDVLLILTVISIFDAEDYLSLANDTKYIYIEMCLKFCEWLTTKKFVAEYFNQKINWKNYTILPNLESFQGIKSLHVRFDKEEYKKAIWKRQEELLTTIMNETHDSEKPIDFDKLNKIAPWKDTRFSISIDEWFDLLSVADIELHFRQKDSHGIFSRGFKRFDEWEPIYRLMCYISLIRQTYLHNSETCFMFNLEIKTKLKALIDLGHQCLSEKVKSDLSVFDNFEVEELFYEFQMLSQTSSLFLRPNVAEVFHHCSAMEEIHDSVGWEFIDKCFKRSFFTKYCVVMSSLDKNAQNKFQAIINSIDSKLIQKTENPNKIEKPLGIEWRDLQLNGRLLKQNIEQVIEQINPNIGKSVIKRFKDKGYYKFARENYVALYDQLGIPTSLTSVNRRGPRTKVLFYHQNRKVSNLETEIEYLPNSLDKVMKLFNDSNCIASAPYLVLITLAHTLQFTQCINSLGIYSHNRIIASFGDAINNIIGVLDKWGFSSLGLVSVRDLFRDEDEYGNALTIDEISSAKVVEIQNQLKEIYKNEFKDSLCFPSIIPSELILKIR